MKKYSEEIKSKIRELRSYGHTHREIGLLLDIPRRTVTGILNRDRYNTTGIYPCPFCYSHNVRVSSTRNNNTGRSGTMYYVMCNSCRARGPRVTYFDRDKDNSHVSEQSVRKQVISYWNNAIVNYHIDCNKESEVLIQFSHIHDRTYPLALEGYEVGGGGVL